MYSYLQCRIHAIAIILKKRRFPQEIGETMELQIMMSTLTLSSGLGTVPNTVELVFLKVVLDKKAFLLIDVS